MEAEQPSFKIKFLITRFSSIGDIVLTTPVIRCLKEQVEGSEVHFLTKKNFAPVLAGNPYIDQLHLYDGNLAALIDALRAEQFDYHIDLHQSLRSRILKARLGVLSFTFDKINFRKWLMVKLKIDRLPRVHIVDRYLETLKYFDVVNDGKGLDFFIPAGDEVPLSRLPAAFSKGYVALVLGAKHATKQLPVHKLVELAQGLACPVVLLGGPDEMAISREVSEASSELVHDTCGKYNLNQSASLVKQARLVISHDTGLMHIASAFHKPLFSVWGNTIPAFGMYPYLPGEASRIFEVQGLSCRPCSRIGYQACPKGHFRCMNEIPIDDIIAQARKIINPGD
jgi:ADP-heptose:LPS heptosyltransferase